VTGLLVIAALGGALAGIAVDRGWRYLLDLLEILREL
jgi:hypothetical protein